MLQSILIRFAFRAAGEVAATVLAEVREKFVEDVLVLPLADVEASDHGDLEFGTHHELLAKGDTYARLWSSWGAP